jgi:hypothetical protein
MGDAVGKRVGLSQMAVRATKNDGNDDDAIVRFMRGLQINLALIEAVQSRA